MKGLSERVRRKSHLCLMFVVLALASCRCSGYTAYRRNSGDEAGPNGIGGNGYSETNINQVADSISIEESSEKIRLRMPNNQILIGNRKTVIFKAKAIRTKKIIYEFLGLPFAEPPLGEKRFMFPVGLSKLFPSETYDATFNRPSCMQAIDETFPGFHGAEMWNAPGEISEDCLYFNLWVPVSQEQDDLLFKHETMTSIRNTANLKYKANGFKDKSSTLKTSLIWFYGGSFSSGTSSLAIYNGTVLAAFENIIVMTPNYRVGPFGFLYLNNSAAPGNAAIADQIMAIEWYKTQYLDFFGGLTSSICLFGESAGAMSLHHLMLTEKRDLFNRVILQSSSSYSDLTYRSPSETYQVWLSFAEKVGCLKIEYEYEDMDVTVPLKLKMRRKKIDWSVDRNQLNERIAKCLIQTDAQTILNKQFEIEFVNEYLKMQSIPTLDYHGLIAIDPIEYSFAKNKHNIYFNHDVLAGVNQNEGTYFMMYYLYYHPTRMADLNGFVNVDKFDYNNEFVIDRLKELFKTLHPSIEYEQILNMDLGDPPKIQILSDDKYNKNITDAINDYFLDKYARCLSDLYTYNKDQDLLDYDLDKKKRRERTPDRAFKKMSKIAGDYTFNCPTIHFANEYSQVHHGRSYVYKFNHRSRAVPWPKWLGVSHGFEIEFVFGVPWTSDAYDADDRLISRKMMNVWANFAKHGKLYCHFDPIGSRQYFIEFVTRSNSTTTPTEDDEYNLFNRYYPTCDLLNELNNKPDYSSKYDECMRYKLKMSVPLNSHTSITASLFLTLLYPLVCSLFFPLFSSTV